MMGLGGGALTALAACGATSSPPPGDGLTTVDDVPQPHPATTRLATIRRLAAATAY